MTKIFIKVKPFSKKEQVIKLGEKNYEVYLKTIPEKGKANRALIKLLSKYFGKPQSQIRIIGGYKIRNKVVEIMADTK